MASEENGENLKSGENTPMKISLPRPGRTSSETVDIEVDRSVVVIGANGSGKTRLGTWLELDSPQTARVHRIAAQKSLKVPVVSATSEPGQAENALLYGHPTVGHASRRGHRWGNEPNTFLLSDFDKLMTVLFTDEFDKSTKYRQDALKSVAGAKPPETRLDKVKRIWESVLPTREFSIGAGTISAQPRDGGTPYAASEMSDGERVALYLIGQALVAMPDGILVVDEPEMHLHRCVQARLWDAIEAERPDCVFVYLTHDLDFAATRVGATRIWLKAYVEGKWDWREIPPVEGLPDSLLYELLGSRKPILFCEGDRGSLDHLLLSRVFGDATIVPMGSCGNVIHATASFQRARSLHSLDCWGIIDLDHRDEDDVEKLRGLGVYTLRFAEMENVLLARPVLEWACKKTGHDPSAVCARVETEVLSALAANRDQIASGIARARVRSQLQHELDVLAGGADDIAAAVSRLFGSVNAKEISAAVADDINQALTGRSYEQALRFVNNKGLSARMSHLFDLKGGGLVGLVKRHLAKKNNGELVAALLSCLPPIPMSPVATANGSPSGPKQVAAVQQV